MKWTGTHLKAALSVVGTMAVLTLTSTNASASVNPVFCGKGTILPFAAATDKEALAARVDPYRVVATYYYRDKKAPENKRVMRFGTAAWGFTHIRNRRQWKTIDTYIIVGCVLTYGRPVSRDGHAYIFRYRFPDVPPVGKTMAGREFGVVYETRSGPQGVITAYSSDIA